MTTLPFFDAEARAAIEGKPDGEALDILAKLISDGEYAKQQGYGPPLDDLNKVRRLWLEIYDRLYRKDAA